MAHTKRLIDAVAALVAVDYPEHSGYRYVFECAIPGTRMMPDIRVMLDGRAICVVEIGYTRPEKLTAYRHELHIPDVRWYDKEGRLHAQAHEKRVTVVEQKVIKVNIKAGPASGVSVYRVRDWVQCIDCPELVGFTPRVPDRAADRFVERFGVDAYLARDTEASLQEQIDVLTWAITDHVSVWLPSYCDKCGRDWMADTDFGGGGEILAWELEGEPRDVGLRMGAAVRMSWDEASAAVLETFGLTLDYLNGAFLQPETDARLKAVFHAEIAQASQDI